ncbi:hypothetical protein [Cerasicoccus frondis]|uniref:hypothetical protein n=1 Tax=Cerasicoccus frondis TaxID=490090 RepID=UPI002852C7C9|nr:hypothetical protein [Cerasicoccus frondis]
MSKEDFEAWWHHEGSGMGLLPEEDQEAHAKRIASIAWSNAEYVCTYQTENPVRKCAEAVVSARHYTGDDGWDKLKNAICELENILEPKGGDDE